MSTEEDKFEIKVRRNPIFALLFMAIGGGLLALGFFIEEYGFMIVGGMALIPGVFAFINPSLVITQEAVVLKNLLGFTGPVHPHDGLHKLAINQGKLVIVYGGRRAELPSPNAKTLHRADWKFLEEALQKAREMKKK